jgi:hypothetical protein
VTSNKKNVVKTKHEEKDAVFDGALHVAIRVED